MTRSRPHNRGNVIATVVGSILVSMGLESGNLKSGLSDVQKRMAATQKSFEQVGQRMQSVGKTMSLAVTAPLVAMGASSMKAAIAAKDAIGQMEASLASMGPAAGKTSEQLQATAKSLEKVSAFDDKEILRKVTSNLLTFGNVSGEAFDRAQLAAVNLASKMQGDLQGATIMVGKALNDPVKGLAAMGKAGIKFTDDQQAMIKSMVASGNAAGAQSLMLGELEKEFSKSGQAARDAAPGSDTANKWSDLQERIGATLLTVADRIEPFINKALDAFNRLSPGAQTTAIAFAGVAAAAGPLLFVGGSVVKVMGSILPVLTKLGPAFKIVQAGFAIARVAALQALPAMLPFLAPLAAIAGAAALVYAAWKHWPEIVKFVTDVGKSISEWWTGSVQPYFDLAGKKIDELVGWFAAMPAKIGGAISGVATAVRTWLVDKLSAVWGLVKEGVSRVVGFYAALPGRVIGFARDLYVGVKAWLSDKLGAVINAVGNKVRGLTEPFRYLWDKVVGHSYIPDMVDGIAAQMARLDAVMVDPAKNATAKVGDAMRQLASDTRSLLDELFPMMAEANARAAKYATIAAAEKAGPGAGGVDAATAAAMRTAMRGAGTEQIPVTGPDLSDIGNKMEEASLKYLENVRPLLAANDNLKQSVADMADGIGQSLANLMGAIKGGGFLDILNGVLGLLDQVGGMMKGGLKLGGLQFGGGGAGGGFGGGIAGARMNGGPVGANRAYRVGERGPEVFRPATAGRIVANDDLSGGRQSVTVHVQANDYFDAKVSNVADGRVAAGAPAIAAGTAGAMQRRQQRRYR